MEGSDRNQIWNEDIKAVICAAKSQRGFQILDVLLHSETTAPQRPNFALFGPPVDIRREVRGEMSKLKTKTMRFR